MKRFILFSIGLLFTGVLQATDYTAVLSGNWNSSSTWSPAGIPTAGDNVTIGAARTVTVAANSSCTNLTVTGALGALTINSGVSLTVSGSFTQLADDATDISTVSVLGTLNVSGDLNMNYTYLLAVTSSNTFTIGDGSTSGTVNVSGNLVFYTSTSVALTVRNLMSLRQGTLAVTGNISFTSAGSGATVQQLEVNDDGSYNSKSKTISMKGALTVQNSNSIKIVDANSNTDFNFIYSGTSQQSLVTTNMVYRNLEISNPAEVILTSNFPSASLLKTLTIKNGGVLNTKSFHLDNINSYAGQISVENGGILRVENSSGVPSQKVSGSYVTSCGSSAIIDFNTTGTLDVITETFTYPIVWLSGTGTKEMTSLGINNSTVFANQIKLRGGTWYVGAGQTIVLTSTLDRTIYLDSGTVWQIYDDFSTFTAFLSINYYNTVQYVKNGNTQRVYSFTASSGSIEPYGNLGFVRRDGLGVLSRQIATGDHVKVRGKVSLAERCELTIGQSAYLELTSDATYTGFIAAIPADATIVYSGTPAGKVIAKKYINLPSANYRDFCSPIKEKTLSTLKNSGILFTGFSGSNYPSYSFNNAYYYDETNTGTLNQGFTGAVSINDSLSKTNASGYLLRSGWRIYAGRSSGLTATLSDTGQVQVGTSIYNLTFTHGANSRTDDDGWNFLGNQYPSALNWSSIYTDPDNAASFAANGIQPTVYIWRPYDTGVPNHIINSYGFYNAATGVGTNLTAVIPSFQGFWVKTHHGTLNSTSFNMYIKESHKTDQINTTFYKSGVNYNEQKIEIALSQNGLTDKIWLHTFPKAKTSFDPMFDIPRMASEPNLLSVNFVDNGESMGLWVNAVSESAANFQLPLLVNLPTAGVYTLSLRNVANFKASYGCLELFDQLTGQSIAITEDIELLYSCDAPYNGIRFILRSTKDLSLDLQLSDATCFDAADGEIALPITSESGINEFSLLKEGQAYKQFYGLIDEIRSPLGRGNYTLINHRGKMSCTSDRLDFSIASYPEVKAEFDIPAQWPVNAIVPIKNTSANAVGFQWLFSDKGTSSSLKDPIYYFENVGSFEVSLQVLDAFGCKSEYLTKPIQIQNASGVEDTARSLGFQVMNENDQIVIYFDNAANIDQCQVYTVDGRLIYASTVPSKKLAIPVSKTNQNVLIHVWSGKNEFRAKYFH